MNGAGYMRAMIVLRELFVERFVSNKQYTKALESKSSTYRRTKTVPNLARHFSRKARMSLVNTRINHSHTHAFSVQTIFTKLAAARKNHSGRKFRFTGLASRAANNRRDVRDLVLFGAATGKAAAHFDFFEFCLVYYVVVVFCG